jgi:ribosomal protein S20
MSEPTYPSNPVLRQDGSCWCPQCGKEWDRAKGEKPNCKPCADAFDAMGRPEIDSAEAPRMNKAAHTYKSAPRVAGARTMLEATLKKCQAMVMLGQHEAAEAARREAHDWLDAVMDAEAALIKELQS